MIDPKRALLLQFCCTCLVALPCVFLVNMAQAQTDRETATVVKGAQSNVTAMVVQKLQMNLATIEKRTPWKVGDDKRPVNPRQHHGREDRVRRVPKARAQIDSLLAFQTRASAVAAAPAISVPILQFDGQGFSGVNPPDMTGDVGVNFYIQAINDSGGTLYTVYKKQDGSVAAGPFALSDLGGPSGKGDPIVLYDHLAKRWVLSEFAASGNKLIIYVSQTSDPISGGWFNYVFDTPHFPDYPKYGVWPDAYYVTSNERDGPAVYALDRSKMLAGDPGAPPSMQRFVANELEGFGFQALTPCDLDGAAPPAGSPNYVMRHRDDEVHNFGANDGSQDFLDLYEFHVDWTDSDNSTLSGPVGVPIAEFDSDLSGLLSFSCFPQKNSSVRLDPLREVIMNRLQYRNFGTHETLVGSFVTDVNGSDHGGVRWFEMRKSPGVAWHIHQEGTYAPDSHHRWMSSIAMNGRGDIAMGYNITSNTMFPGLRYVGRLSSDPMGTMVQGERVFAKGTGANSSIRYGDYSALTVDPTNDSVFWFTGEYNKTGNWSTRIGTFKFEQPDPDETDDGPDDEVDGDQESDESIDKIKNRLESLEGDMQELKDNVKKILDVIGN